MTERFAEGMAADDREDFEEAYRIWKELAEEDPRGIPVLRYGWAAFHLKRWQEAQDALERMIELKPKASIVMQMLGLVWFRRTDTEGDQHLRTAKAWFLKALERKRTAPTLSMLGAVYQALDDNARAIEAFEEALKVDEKYEEAMCNLAHLIGEDDPVRAISLLETALEIDPHYASAHQRVGVQYERQGKIARAEFHFRRSIESDPADYWSHLYLANVLAVQDENEEAESLYEFATELHPDIEGGSEVFANFLDSIGKHQKARTVRKRAQNAGDEGKP